MTKALELAERIKRLGNVYAQRLADALYSDEEPPGVPTRQAQMMTARGALYAAIDELAAMAARSEE